MKRLLLLLLVFFIACCQAEKDPKEKLLGHWKSETSQSHYYFGQDRFVFVGNTKGEGLTRYDAPVVWLDSDSEFNIVTLSIEHGAVMRLRCTLLESNRMKVENLRGDEPFGAAFFRRIDDKQEP